MEPGSRDFYGFLVVVQMHRCGDLAIAGLVLRASPSSREIDLLRMRIWQVYWTRGLQ